MVNSLKFQKGVILDPSFYFIYYFKIPFNFTIHRIRRIIK